MPLSDTSSHMIYLWPTNRKPNMNFAHAATIPCSTLYEKYLNNNIYIYKFLKLKALENPTSYLQNSAIRRQFS